MNQQFLENYKGYNLYSSGDGIAWSDNGGWLNCVFDTVETAKYFIDRRKLFTDNYYQYDAAKTLLERDPNAHTNCKVELKQTDIKLADGGYRDIDSIFNEYTVTDFKLVGYSSDEEIKVEMLAPKQ